MPSTLIPRAIVPGEPAYTIATATEPSTSSSSPASDSRLIRRTRA
jgi:hypothetical protein